MHVLARVVVPARPRHYAAVLCAQLMDELHGLAVAYRRHAYDGIQQKAAAHVPFPQGRSQRIQPEADNGGYLSLRALRAHGQRAEMALGALALPVCQKEHPARIPAEKNDPRVNILLSHPAAEASAIHGSHAVGNGPVSPRSLHHGPKAHQLAVGKVCLVYARELAHATPRSSYRQEYLPASTDQS